MSTTVIRYIPQDLLLDLWPRMKPWVAAAMDYHPYVDAEDCLVLAWRGHLTPLAAVVDGQFVGICLLEVVEYPRLRVANMMVIAGERSTMESWLDPMLSAVEEWAEARGCSGISGYGRRGWMREVERRTEQGWRCEPAVGIHKELAHEQGRRNIDYELGAVERGTTLPH